VGRGKEGEACVLPRGLRRGQVNFRSHNSCLSLGASSPGRRRACVLFGVSFRAGYSPTGLPGDTAWLAFPPTGWGWLGVSSQAAALPFRRSKGGSHTDDDGIQHRDCSPCHAAALRRQQAVAPARLSTPAGRLGAGFAPPPPHPHLSSTTDLTFDRSRSFSAADAGAPAVGAGVSVDATAEIRLVAPAGVLCAKAALPPPPLRYSLPAAQTGDAAKLGGSVVQLRGLKTRTSRVAALGGDSTRDTEQASCPRCGAPSPGARTGTAVAFLSLLCLTAPLPRPP